MNPSLWICGEGKDFLSQRQPWHLDSASYRDHARVLLLLVEWNPVA
eukprot:CAMPEP_0117884440 /NCGR_PEP_ID=MMETSP0950-20121206/18892_1 /TAXON_ID=44440 /ORGANISM="Chattonella subsalsa, Strain CCMP2191" /LENGTH=45 /DNA_ID= /DNA_START= /DNA_END= /DNA_ORIENTATION=